MSYIFVNGSLDFVLLIFRWIFNLNVEISTIIVLAFYAKYSSFESVEITFRTNCSVRCVVRVLSAGNLLNILYSVRYSAHIFNEYPASLTVCLCLDVSCLICLPLIWWQANMEWYSLWILGSGVAFKRPHILSAHNRQRQPGSTPLNEAFCCVPSNSGLGMRMERCDVWCLERSVSCSMAAKNILKCLKAGKKMF